MADIKIPGPDGRPIRRDDLTREVAAPSLSGVRRSWRSDSVASVLTPDRLASLLRAADQGDADAYLTLAEEMEIRNLHYAGVLGARKRAVLRLPISVEAASDDKADQDLADEVRRLLTARGLRSGLAHALDGLGKGFAAVELNWDTSRTPWMPRDRIGPSGRRVRGYTWRDPRWFRYDRETGAELRLLDQSAPVDGLPLPPYRFIVHEPELKSGIPLRNGLARLACVAYMAKSYTLRDWLAFAELFGLPIRVGKWQAGASQEDIAVLLDAVANIGTDAAAAIPASMSIEFVQAAGGGSSGGNAIFRELADWLDEQVTIAVLGQIGSTKGQPGALGGQEQMGEVRTDVRDSDAEQLADTLAFDLVDAYLRINHGPIDPDQQPRIAIREPDQEDIRTLSEVAARMIGVGLRVDAKRLRDRLTLPDPDPNDAGAEVVGGPPALPPAVPAAPAPVTTPFASDLNRVDGHGAGCGCGQDHRVEINDMATPARVLDEIAAEPLADWEPLMAPVVDPIVRAAREVADLGLPEAEGFALFLDRLEALAGDLDPAALIDSLARATFQARGYGDARDV